MKKFLLSILLAISLNASAATQEPPHPINSCKAQAPFGFPSDSKSDTMMVCRTAYVLQHDDTAKIPVWVSYVLTPEHTNGCVQRTNGFKEDDSIPKGKRAELGDYRNSGYDKGHIANDADMTWSAISEQESLILSNMTPQIHGLNAGIWKELETAVRSWAFNRKHPLLVYAGPIYDVKTDKTIGSDKVVVPHSFYKIVVDLNTKETLAFVFPHSNVNSTDLKPFQTTVSNIEKLTGVTFEVPQDKNLKSNIWPIDFKPLAKSKKQLCTK